MKFTHLLLLIFPIGILLFSCNPTLNDPQEIVDKTILFTGGDKYLNAVIEFDFRGRHYVARRNGGTFSYERIFDDSLGTVHDIVSNEGFARKINEEEATVPDTMAVKYTSSTNSVIYFALLPYGLNDAAVIKKLMGETSIKDKPYYLVQITFKAGGGGEDHEDVFLYWINQKTFAVDYLAYSFAERDEISFRFREAYNARVINGIRIQDYINFKPKNNSLTVEQAEELYRNGELVELSRIETENVTVN